MKLRNKTNYGALALGLTLALGACGRGNDTGTTLSSADRATANMGIAGPSGDYPIILGDPYSIDGQLYTPADTMSYDEVGYAASDNGAGLAAQGITAAHKTLPLPSYVEVTSLETGRTILVRVERRGPMTSERLLELSPDAHKQLGSAEGTPVRVRRVNPPENDRHKLRLGQSAPERMATPQSLVTVLKRKMPERGSVNLGSAELTKAAGPMKTGAPVPPKIAASAPSYSPAEAPADVPIQAPALAPTLAPVQPPKTAPTSTPSNSFTEAFIPAAPPAAYPLDPIEPAAQKQASITSPAEAAQKPELNMAGKFVVQAAAFSKKANADRAAKALGGYVVQAGRYYRVKLGPYTSRGQADAALAKVHAAGYSDARVSTAG